VSSGPTKGDGRARAFVRWKAKANWAEHYYTRPTKGVQRNFELEGVVPAEDVKEAAGLREAVEHPRRGRRPCRCSGEVRPLERLQVQPEEHRFHSCNNGKLMCLCGN
jgi:hypothetical protein